MAFHRGQKVVCIRADWKFLTHPDCIGDPSPAIGAVVTIRDFDDWTFPGHLGIALCEFPNIYLAAFFRPVVERKLPESLTALQDIKNHTPLPDAPSTIPKEAFV